jgi:hypothetical protein
VVVEVEVVEDDVVKQAFGVQTAVLDTTLDPKAVRSIRDTQRTVAKSELRRIRHRSR